MNVALWLQTFRHLQKRLNCFWVIRQGSIIFKSNGLVWKKNINRYLWNDLRKGNLTKMVWTFYFDARVHELQKSDSLEFCWKTFIINFSGIGIIQSKSFEEYWQITGSGRPRLQMEGNNIIFFLEQERWKFYSWCETYIGQNILWKSLVNSRLNTWVRTRNCKMPPRTSICMSF